MAEETQYPKVEELGHEIYGTVVSKVDAAWDFIKDYRTPHEPPFWEEVRDVFIEKLSEEVKKLPGLDFAGERAKMRTIGVILEKYPEIFPKEVRERWKIVGGSNPRREVDMDEIRAKQIAEEAAVKASELTHAKLIREFAKEGGNPVSEKCERVLETTPKCYDFRGIRRWVMCRAWQEMEARRIPFGEAIRTGWSEARRACSWE